MDESEKYQQRLQAIAERRQRQEEEERLRRESEEERLKLAQKKRKCLRDQWFSEPAPVLPSVDTLRPHPPLEDRPDERPADQKTPEEKEEAADVREEEEPVQREENKASVKCTDTAASSNQNQAAVEEEVLKRVSRAAEGHFPGQMTQRMFHASGQDGRSVLGMVAVQVERDPKTGATVIRSVAPVSTPAGTGPATTVFDDGRKSVHAVGGSGDQPSAEELGQILSAIDGVGMKVLLDEVTITPQRVEMKTETVDDNATLEEKEGKVPSRFARDALSRDNNGRLHNAGEQEEEEWEQSSMAVVREVAGKVDNLEERGVEYRVEEGPVTLTFLGYNDAVSGQRQDRGAGLDGEDHGGLLTVERVIITDEGEETVLGPVSSGSLSSASGPGLHPSDQGLEDSVASGGTQNKDNAADLDLGGGGGAAKGTQEGAFQDIPLDGNGMGLNGQGEEADKSLHNSASPNRAQGEGSPKRKTCQCCSVM
ncbi:uncharacterized protein ACJ7VT_002090 isoform 2-T2 [Polymixia lowei]